MKNFITEQIILFIIITIAFILSFFDKTDPLTIIMLWSYALVNTIFSLRKNIKQLKNMNNSKIK